MSRLHSLLRIPCLLACVSLLFSSVARAQSFVYVNNQDTTNTISGFSVETNGVLTAIPGSPFITGGAGSTTTCYGLDRIAISATAKLLFVSNSGDQTISAFQIDTSTGSLTLAPGSPVASGLTLDSCGIMSLAATPDGQYLMASSNGRIQSFSIAANGALTPAVLTTNCCAPMVGMKISADGKLLAVSNETSVSIYTINPDGSLTLVPGSPFPQMGTGLVSGLEFSCAADRLYASEASFGKTAITDAWSVSASGTLTPIAGSPFLSSGTDANVVLLSPDNAHLFTTDQLDNAVTSFNVAADGSLARIGAFGSPASLHVPSGVATDAVGQYLFIADDTFGLAVFSIGGDGSLAPLSDVATIPGQEMQSVAAYPSRSCSAADLSLVMTASPSTVESGSNVTFSISITNGGSTSAAAVITDNLPAGTSIVTCSASNGVCGGSFGNPHTISFASIAPGATEIATIVAQTSTDLLNGTTLSNTASISNKSVVDANPANDSASSTVAISAQPGPTTLSISPAAGAFGGTAMITATLLKPVNGIGISGKSVAFTLNGQPIGSAVTNKIGQAILNTSVAGMALGSYPGAITATFAGDAVFAASSGTGDLTVGRAVLTVIPGSATRVYGDSNPPSFPYSITGFLNNDNSSVISGAAVCSSAATALSNVGKHAITCDISGLSAANYVFTVAPGTLTVTPALLTVAADSFSRIYGDPNPTFTGAITGLKNGDVITATYTSQATAASPVGVYPIVPSVVPSAVSGNYTITLLNGKLTITAAQLTVNVNNASRAYGDPNPPFTGTLVGLRSGDGITAVYSTIATQLSPVGSYAITATLLDPNFKLSNYTVTINPGTITILPASLTVTAASVSRVYGNANPIFTGTISGVKNGDNITATYATAATIASSVGTYPIVPTLIDPAGKLANYAVTIINSVLTITPAPLTVAINNASRAYGSNNPTLNGSITGLKNGDNITATYSTVGPTSPVGTYPITPTFNDPGAKLGNYTVTITGGVLTITPAPLTVAAIGGSRLYGDPNPAATIAGLQNGDNITVTYSSPTAASPIGTYTLSPILVDPAGKLSNYAVTIKTAVLTINKAPLTVSANNATRVYGSANPAFTGSISGIKNNDNLTPNPTTTATPATNVGTAVITAGVNDPNGVLGNYAVTANNGTLTITKAPLTVTANNATVVLNTTTPGFTASYTGFVLGQTPSVLSGTLSCSASLNTVGAHPITCSGQSSNNYTLTFVPGTATVDYAPVGTCSAGPGHQILVPISTSGSTTFPRATTSTIAVQFRVCDAKGTAVSSAGVVSSFTLLQQITGGVATTINQPQSTAFAFNGTNQDWVFNLSTSTPTNLAAGSTYVYQINLNDGTSINFQFSMN